MREIVARWKSSRRDEPGRRIDESNTTLQSQGLWISEPDNVSFLITIAEPHGQTAGRTKADHPGPGEIKSDGLSVDATSLGPVG